MCSITTLWLCSISFNQMSNDSTANELEAYSPAVLYKILPEDYYQHHLLLVEGILVTEE